MKSQSKKEDIAMKKNIILKTVSIIFMAAALFAVICAITVTGGGFLDLSNIARFIYISAAVIFCIIAAFAWKFSKPKN